MIAQQVSLTNAFNAPKTTFRPTRKYEVPTAYNKTLNPIKMSQLRTSVMGTNGADAREIGRIENSILNQRRQDVFELESYAMFGDKANYVQNNTPDFFIEKNSFQNIQPTYTNGGPQGFCPAAHVFDSSTSSAIKQPMSEFQRNWVKDRDRYNVAKRKFIFFMSIFDTFDKSSKKQNRSTRVPNTPQRELQSNETYTQEQQSAENGPGLRYRPQPQIEAPYESQREQRDVQGNYDGESSMIEESAKPAEWKRYWKKFYRMQYKAKKNKFRAEAGVKKPKKKNKPKIIKAEKHYSNPTLSFPY